MVATLASGPPAEPTGTGAGVDGGVGEFRNLPSGLHFPALDGARAVAAIGVFITHLGLLSGYITRHGSIGPYLARMDVGVSVFFVLSGFLLYRPFVGARLSGAEPRSVATYARRRLLRIFPAYWVALVIIAFVLKAPGFEEPHSIVAHFLLIHIYDGTQVVGGPIQQSWTLATELAFYAFIPVFAWFMARRERNADKQLRFEIITLISLFVASGLANVVLVAMDVKGSTYAQLGTWLPFRLTDFIPGMGLAVLSAWVAKRERPFPGWMSGPGFALGCWAMAIGAFWFVSTRLGLPMFPTFTTRQAFAVRVIYLFIAVVGVLPCVVGRQRGGVVQVLLANRAIVWVGLVSYGIYIWHEAWMILYQRWFDEPVLASNFIRMGIFSVVTTIATAAISWYVIEKPSIAWGRRQGLPSEA